jgi:NADH-quinone oxidoreductase subunit N
MPIEVVSALPVLDGLARRSAAAGLSPGDLAAVAPLLALTATALLILMADALLDDLDPRFPAALSLLGLAGAAWLLLGPRLAGSVQVFTRAVTTPDGVTRVVALLRHDAFATYAGAVVLLSALATVLLALDRPRRRRGAHGAFCVLVLLATAAMLLLTMADDFIVLFLAVETFSLALYVLCAFRRGDRRGLEAGLKYFVLGSAAAGVLLYGVALLYATTGSTNLDVVGESLATARGDVPVLGLVGLGLVLAGLGFKTSLAPLHQWTPDVYEGAPTAVTAFMAAATKVAAFAALGRVLWTALPALAPAWTGLLAVMAVLTMLVGNLGALVQSDVKRMLGWSAVAHAGYILVALLPGSVAGNGAALFYLLVYAVMNLGAFGALLALGPRAPGDAEPSHLDDLKGLARRQPWLALALALFMLGLVGLPPTAGFLGKWYIFQAAVASGWTVLAVAIVLNSVLSALYYLRPVMYMYVTEPDAAVSVPVPAATASVVGVAAVATALAVLVASPLVESARAAGAVGTVQTARPASGSPAIVVPVPSFEKGRR